MKPIDPRRILLSDTFPYRGTPHIQHVEARFEDTPTARVPTVSHTVVPTKPESHLDRESIIALGLIITLATFIVLFVIQNKYIKRHEQALRSLQVQPDVESQRQSIFRKFSMLSSAGGGRRSSSYHGSDTRGRRRRSSDTVVAQETPMQREKRWWGSVAAHGSAVKADAEVRFPVLPHKPRTARSLPRAFGNEGESPGTWRENAYEGERVGGFQRVVWRTERNEIGLDVRGRSIGVVQRGREVQTLNLARNGSSATV
jgi:hypothetical protein